MEEVILPKPENFPANHKPGYHLIKKGDLLVWWAMPHAHVHVFEVIAKETRVAELHLRLIKCLCKQEVLDKLFQEQLNQPNHPPCEIGTVVTRPMFMLDYKGDNYRWLQTDAEKVLFGVK